LPQLVELFAGGALQPMAHYFTDARPAAHRVAVFACGREKGSPSRMAWRNPAHRPTLS
jgi:hypothetical protein